MDYFGDGPRKTTISIMIYNETLVKSYGSAPEVFMGTSPKPCSVLVSAEDYSVGYVRRTFAKKANEDVVVEIKYSDSASINTALYKIVNLNWKVSGPKNDVMKNGILDKAGVVEQNFAEIDRVNVEQGVDLTRQLSNLLEFWRGY
jgi:hypothetical protein